MTGLAPSPAPAPVSNHGDTGWTVSVRTAFRRLALWTLTCSVSAAPSFAIALSEGYDPAGMLVGIGLFIVGLTAITCTEAFERRLRRPHVRATLYTGYGVRMALSLAFPLSFFVDIWPGVVTMATVEALGLGSTGFTSALVHTVIQGGLMNLIVGVFMSIVYVGLRLFVRPPSGGGPRCPDCNYDLRGSGVSSACPECGRLPASAAS